LNEISKEELEKISTLTELMSQSYGKDEASTQRNERMFLVRAGTPISDINPDDLPSPRGDNMKKEVQVLPHYAENRDKGNEVKRIP